jgi:hypothetical protein
MSGNHRKRYNVQELRMLELSHILFSLEISSFFFFYPKISIQADLFLNL